MHTLQRTVGNRATTQLIEPQRQATATDTETAETAEAGGHASDPKPLRPDASQEELHQEYLRGKEMFDLGMYDEAAAVWTPVYAHPMSRGDGQKKASLALIIGRAKQKGGHPTDAIGWYEECTVTPGVDPETRKQAQQFLTQCRRGSEEEQGGGGASLDPDASEEDVYAAYLDGRGLYGAGLFDEAAAKWLAVYEHPKTDAQKKSGLAVYIGNAHFHAHHFDRALSWYQEGIVGEGADPGMREYVLDKIAKCRRGSTEDAGVAVGEAIDPDAGDDVLAAAYHEGVTLYQVGLFERAISKWVSVYEHKNSDNTKRTFLALRIGTAFHQLLNFSPAISWYTEALTRGMEDRDAIVTHKRLAQARDSKPMVTPASEARPNISLGWTGTHVRHLQEQLNRFGFECKIDGIFGSETDAVVRKFQSHNGLKPDGIVGPRTWTGLV